VTIPDTNVVVELYIYDCAGQSIFNQLDLNAKYVSCSCKFPVFFFNTNLTQYEEASAVLVVYSVANRDTLQSCSRWYNGKFHSTTTVSIHTQISFLLTLQGVRSIRSNVNLIGALVGNKAEYRDGTIDSRAEVSTEEATAMAGSMGVPYFETSAVSLLNNFFGCFCELNLKFHRPII
jgi:hypothetical protein